MPKGMFTQCVCVMLEKPVSVDEMESCLTDFAVRRQVPPGEQWEFQGPGLVVEYDAECNGFIVVDVVDRPWPDHMGSPEDDMTLFGAWSMGHFGPGTYPGSLQRAAQQSWAWEGGQAVPENHHAFLRVRSTYILGTDDDAPMMPQDYDALSELHFVSCLALALLQLPEAVCYFNPSGEVLRDQQSLHDSLEFAQTNELPPLDAWENARLYNINQEWSLMDTVGNTQLDVDDVEACFHTESYDFNEIDNFLRNVTLYTLHSEHEISDGDTMNGPGEVPWQCRSFENGLTDPPRRVLRWWPLDDRPMPPEVERAGGEEAE